MAMFSDFGDFFQTQVDPLDITGKRAGEQTKAILEQGGGALGLQKDWMDFIKREYAPYSEVAQKALTAQQGLAGLNGTEMQNQMISDIQNDPFYQAKLKAGAEAILRGASATGGLRSGNTNAALSLQNQILLNNEIENRYQKLAGLSGQGFTGQQAGSQFGGQALDQITGTMGTMTSGAIAGQAAQENNRAGILSGVGGVLGGIFSDKRLKYNIKKVGKKNGLNWYTWVWNKLAEEKLNLSGKGKGHLADEVLAKYPNAVNLSNGFLTVNYGEIN